jgi:polysaccharide pyruvyl transferase WcaK-like protein
MKKILLVGYSGHKNFGDDLLVFHAYQQFTNDFDLTVWTSMSNASYLEEMMPGIKVIVDASMALGILINFDVVLFFGGGVFFDYTAYENKQYVRKVISAYKNFLIPSLLGVKFIGIGIGLGPFLTDRSKTVNRIKLRLFKYLSLRDKYSYELAESYGIKAKIEKGYDLSFLNAIEHGVKKQNKNKKIIICPRKFPHGKTGDVYHTTLCSWARMKSREGFHVDVFGFQMNHDEKVVDLYAKEGFSATIWDPDEMKIQDVFTKFADADVVISSRMHGIYVAGMVGTPSVGINVHHKVRDATEMFSNSTFLIIDFSVEKLEDSFQEVIGQPQINDLSAYKHSAEKAYRSAVKISNA